MRGGGDFAADGGFTGAGFPGDQADGAQLQQMIQPRPGLGQGGGGEQRVGFEFEVEGELGKREVFAVERFEAGGILWAQAGNQLRAHGLEPAFDFSLSPGPVRTGMNQSDAQFGAHQRQVPVAVMRAIVDVEAFTEAAP